MADVFLSYARQDAAVARTLAAALRDEGWSVWWDRDLVPGVSFDDKIETELAVARCVVTIWSKDSVRSHWVKDETREAQRRKILVTCRVDAVEPPLGFRAHEYANLEGWNALRSAPEFQRLCLGIKSHAPLSPPGVTAVSVVPSDVFDERSSTVPDARHIDPSIDGGTNSLGDATGGRSVTSTLNDFAWRILRSTGVTGWTSRASFVLTVVATIAVIASVAALLWQNQLREASAPVAIPVLERSGDASGPVAANPQSVAGQKSRSLGPMEYERHAVRMRTIAISPRGASLKAHTFDLQVAVTNTGNREASLVSIKPVIACDGDSWWRSTYNVAADVASDIALKPQQTRVLNLAVQQPFGASVNPCSDDTVRNVGLQFLSASSNGELFRRVVKVGRVTDMTDFARTVGDHTSKSVIGIALAHDATELLANSEDAPTKEVGPP